ncbi:general secretion pathway protein GspB [Marinobacter segnicrescens]|uniref:general secretion pathway protein GspB n=1 Tax=Marinobacter segnicrescens TaxID=430453 RepID=UPI003A9031EF
MSYILEALKKSESERNQGRVPDLGQQVRMIHRRHRRGIPALGWLAIALTLNALVLGVLFWPDSGLLRTTVVPDPAPAQHQANMSSVSSTPSPAADSPTATEAVPQGGTGAGAQPLTEAPGEIAEATGDLDGAGVVVLDTLDEAPTVIVPTVRPANPDGSDDAYSPAPWEGRVPHLVELPMAFQRQVPDLVFNSHVYSSRPSARSVMINNRYLRMGDTLGPLRIENITEDGVELSMDGQRFRVGVVRDWSSPR